MTTLNTLKGIIANQEATDFLEVITDNYIREPKACEMMKQTKVVIFK